MANINNVRLGVCSINWKTQDLGHTLGGVTFTYERSFSQLKVDKYGDNEVDAALTGTSLKISVKVAEPVAALIQRFVPEGTNLSGANGQQVGFASGEGDTMRAYAGLLTLHPLNKAASDTSEDISVYLAYPSGNNKLNYEVNNQRVVEVEFSAFVSEAYTAGKRLGHIGPVNIS